MFKFPPQFHNAKFPFLCGVVLALILGVRCIRLWQPERQIELHQAHLLTALGDRHWKKVDRFIAPTFTDRVGHDKAWVLRESREVLRQFIALDIKAIDPEIEPLAATPEIGVVRSRLQIIGTGSPIANYAKETVNSSTHPFLFTWKRQSWKPWDWQLTTLDQPILDQAGQKTSF